MSEEKLCLVDFNRLHKFLELPLDVRIKRVAVEPVTQISKIAGAPLGKYRRESCEALAVYTERIEDDT